MAYPMYLWLMLLMEPKRSIDSSEQTYNCPHGSLIQMCKLYRMVLIVVLVLLVGAVTGNLLSDAVVVQPLTAASSNTSYSFTFTNQNTATLPALSSLVIFFSTSAFSGFSVQSCILTLNQLQPFTPTCSVNSINQIVFSSINSSPLTLSNFTVRFNGKGAMYATSVQVQVFFVDSSGTNVTAMNGAAFFNIIPLTMSGCNVSTDSAVVGDSATWTINFVPSVDVVVNSSLKVTLPKWGPLNDTNFVATPSCSLGTCSKSASASTQILTISGISSFSSPFSLTVSSLRNPSSTYPTPIIFQIFTSTNQVQNCSATVTATQPNVLNTDFPLSNTTILATNSVGAFFSLTTPLPSNGYIRLSTPLSVSYHYSNMGESNTPIKVATADRSLLLTNLSNTVILSYSLGHFQLLNPPSIFPATIILTTQILLNSIFYDVDSTIINFHCSPSTIVTKSVTFSPQNANVVSTYQVNFSTVNPLLEGSFVRIGFPSEVEILPNTTCSSTLGACVVGEQVNLTLAAPLAGNSQVSVTVTGVLNAYTTTPSSSLTVQTFYNSSKSLVDSLGQGMSVTAIPNPLSQTTLNVSNSTVGATTSYFFQIVFKNPVLPESTLIIQFPSSIDVSSLSVPSSPCVPTISPSSLLLSNCFTTNSSTSLSITLSNIRNPRSTQPVSSFNVTLSYNNLLLEYLLTPIILTMTSLAPLSLSIASTNSTVSAETSYLFTVTFTQPHTTGDILLITVPQEITLKNPVCTVVSGASGILSCALTERVLAVGLLFSSFPTNFTIQFSVSSFTNTWYASTSTFSVTSQSGNYSVESGTGTLTSTAGTLPVTVSWDNNIILLGISTIKITVSPPFPMTSSTLLLSIPFPSSSLNLTSCTSSLGSCTHTSNNILNITSLPNFLTPITLSVTSTTGYFQTTSQFPVTLLDTSHSLIASNMVNVSVFCQSECQQCLSDRSSCLSCFNSSHSQLVYYVPSSYSCVKACPAMTFLSSSDSSCLSCSSNCLNCTTTSETCTSCFNNSYLYNSKCYPECPATTYLANGICSPCSPSCLNCQNFSLCTSCQPNLVLSSHSCIPECPFGTTAINSICTQCSHQCLTCAVSTTNCLTCQPLLYKYFSTCVQTCPNGTYGYNGTCGGCISPCQTCSILADNCTSCLSGYLLNGKCVASCTFGYYPDATGQCQSCGNCFLCTSPINCTSCLTGFYLLNNRCYDACPPSHPIPSGNTCVACDPTCLSCETLTTNCTSCKSGTFLLGSNCLQECPSEYSANSVTNTCDKVAKSMIYFPGLISGGVLAGIVLASKIFFKQTSVSTGLVALLAIPQLTVQCYFIYLLSVNRANSVALALAIVSLLLLISLSVTFTTLTTFKVSSDQYLKLWVKQHKIVYWTLLCISTLSFKIYRLIYSQLFNLQSLSTPIKNPRLFLLLTNILTVSSVIVVQIPTAISCVIIVYLSHNNDQLFFQAIDCLILASLIGIAQMFDIPKGDDYFVGYPFMRNRVGVIDGKINIEDHVDGLDEAKVGRHGESCEQKGGHLLYKVESGCYFDDSLSRIKVAEDSVAESLNTGMAVQVESKSLKTNGFDGKNLQEESSYELDRNEQEEEEEEEEQFGEKEQEMDEEKVQFENGVDERGDWKGEFEDQEALGLQMISSASPPNQKSQKSQKVKTRILNIFDPIQEQTEEQLLNELQSFRTNEQFFGDNMRRPRSQQRPNPSTSLDNKSTISVFNQKQLRQRWNKIIHHKVQNLRQINEDSLKPLPVTTINEISQTSSSKGAFRKRTLRKPFKKEYHNKQLEAIYLQRMVPPTKAARSQSAKPSFRSGKYKS